MASPNVLRSQPWVTVIGSRNSPKAERMPKPIMAIRQPARMTTIGVRQPGPAEVDGSEAAFDMGSSAVEGRCGCVRGDRL